MSDLKKLTTLLANDVKDNEKLSVFVLTSKLKKLAELFPSDQTIVHTSRVLSKMGETKAFISRADFKHIYTRLYSYNTKMADYFKDELGQIEKLASPKYAPKQEAPISDLYAAGNSVLAAVLKTGLAATEETKEFKQENANKALLKVNETLDIWGAKASHLEVNAGNEDGIVVKASYDTPKGVVSMLIPVQIKNGKALDPLNFIGSFGLQKIDYANIKNYLAASIEANSKEVGREGQSDLEMPKGKDFDTFADKFNTPLGVATFNFGADKVNIGRDAIVRTLAGFGVDHPQISILASDKSAIVYGVSVGGKVAFKVPVKVANNKILPPELMICNGSIMGLTRGNINNLYAKNETDYKVAASTSPAYGLKVNELLNIIREAAVEHNYAKAEDALNVIQASGNEKAFKEATKEYMNGLLMTKTAETKSSCSMIIKSATSQHPVCGHTGLPINKVFQDKYGNCQPLYRKETPETYEVAAFSTHKVFG